KRVLRVAPRIKHGTVWISGTNAFDAASGFVFFFFQAEDGIRDFHVTGVQTCALPISLRTLYGALLANAAKRGDFNTLLSLKSGRSEERRVGKEWRCRGWPDHEKKNSNGHRAADEGRDGQAQVDESQLCGEWLQQHTAE